MDESRGGLLSAGGILAIIIGVFELMIGGLVAACAQLSDTLCRLPGCVVFDDMHNIAVVTDRLFVAGIVLGVLGILAIAGGISAIRRKSFGLSLAGAICALPSCPLGILAVIFVSLGKREF